VPPNRTVYVRPDR